MFRSSPPHLRRWHTTKHTPPLPTRLGRPRCRICARGAEIGHLSAVDPHAAIPLGGVRLGGGGRGAHCDGLSVVEYSRSVAKSRVIRSTHTRGSEDQLESLLVKVYECEPIMCPPSPQSERLPAQEQGSALNAASPMGKNQGQNGVRIGVLCDGQSSTRAVDGTSARTYVEARHTSGKQPRSSESQGRQRQHGCQAMDAKAVASFLAR